MPGEMLSWVDTHYPGPSSELQLRVDRIPVPARGCVVVRNEVIGIETACGSAGSAPRGRALWLQWLNAWCPSAPGIKGALLAGRIAATANQVPLWKVGDRVLVCTSASGGAHAQYTMVSPRHAMVPLAPDQSAAQAVAGVLGGVVPVHILRRVGLAAGQRVLVIGAASTTGSICVQLALAVQAHVTALARTAQLALASAIGAHRVLDWSSCPPAGFAPRSFDVVIDTCRATSLQQCERILSVGGVYLDLQTAQGSRVERTRSGRYGLYESVPCSPQALGEVLNLLHSERLHPLIDSTWDFHDLPMAHARAKSGHASGAVLVRIP